VKIANSWAKFQAFRHLTPRSSFRSIPTLVIVTTMKVEGILKVTSDHVRYTGAACRCSTDGERLIGKIIHLSYFTPFNARTVSDNWLSC